MEEFVTGYCRVLDAARTVLVDLDEHCADCSYPDCPYCADCSVSVKISEVLSK